LFVLLGNLACILFELIVPVEHQAYEQDKQTEKIPNYRKEHDLRCVDAVYVYHFISPNNEVFSYILPQP
jgi:hypothetical protein